MTTETTKTIPEYSLDKKTGEVTMPDGFKFNPYTNENCEALTLEQLRVYHQERPPAEPTATVDVEALAAEYANAAAAAQPYLDTMADIKAKLLEALPVGTHEAGPLSVQVKAGARTLDAKKLEAAFPLADNPLFYKQTLDTNAVKQFVAPIVLEQYQRQNAPSLVIK